MEVIYNYIIQFGWPNMTKALLKRLLVFCRDLINKYAAYKSDGETATLAIRFSASSTPCVLTA